ncbi:GntR family transcriptional regulator [Streptomyces sp. NPDC055506]
MAKQLIQSLCGPRCHVSNPAPLIRPNVSQQASPRGTFLRIADALKARIAADPDMTELPSLAEVMRDHRVSRGLALRAFGVLRQDGVAEPAPGERWRVMRSGIRVDRLPLDQRIADIITAEGLASETTTETGDRRAARALRRRRVR